ncbi:PREDICTED: uncharacterized protein LOC106815112 [Priapulus caudatus]|uniref:NADH dehydrogenase [ubiquinone] 1 beta subcomplex subunit 4 n=1 Tax=Priapulus caudatus TaxID=37621 RepID=A0ABM1ES53_PRICU|nr:PREDICTED: uncharacterized protein LOC106815112 [Priapulus caudatus]
MASKQFDATPAEIRAAAERAATRDKLKWQFRQQMENPNALKGEGGYVFDPASQRFLSMRVTQFDHFRATPKTSALGLGLFVLPIAFFTYLIYREKTTFEKKCREGKISYKDRNFKFA